MERAQEAPQTRAGRPRVRTPLTSEAPTIWGVDGRKRSARRFREIYAELVTELGRRPTQAEGARLVDAALLVVASEDLLARVTAGERCAVSEHLKVSYALRSALDSLGLGRGRK
jgi:hypothetical protein